MDKRIEELAKWGCDVRSAMERMAGDEGFYLECLSMAVEDKGLSELAEQLKIRNATAAFEAAHSLKGVYANLGLTPMLKKIDGIVEPLREGDCNGLEAPAAELAQMNERLRAILG